jgi:hypothetical protein
MAYIRQLETFGTRNAFSDTQSETFGIGAARRWIFNEFVRVGNGRLTVEFQDFPFESITATRPTRATSSPPCRARGRVRHTGADGPLRQPSPRRHRRLQPGDRRQRQRLGHLALCMETARIMSSRDWNQTIVFLATSAEEQGAFGARYYAENAFLDGKNVIAASTTTLWAGAPAFPQHVRLFAVDYLTSNHGALGRYYEYVGGLYLPTFPVSSRTRSTAKGAGATTASSFASAFRPSASSNPSKIPTWSTPTAIRGT